MDKNRPKEFPTAIQTTHPNSAIFHPANNNYVLVTFFGTSENSLYTNESFRGSGGKLIALQIEDNKFTGSFYIIKKDLHNPHNIINIGNGFFGLTESSKGTFVIYKERSFLNFEKVGELDFSNLPSKKEAKPWVHTVTYNKNTNLFTAIDTQTHSIEILDLKNSKRRRIEIADENWATHKAFLI